MERKTRSKLTGQNSLFEVSTEEINADANVSMLRSYINNGIITEAEARALNPNAATALCMLAMSTNDQALLKEKYNSIKNPSSSPCPK